MSNMDRIRNNHLRTAEVFNRLEVKKVIKAHLRPEERGELMGVVKRGMWRAGKG